jgi:hypothetical protein
MNNLLNAFVNKKDRAANIEENFQNKRDKLSVKVSKAKSDSQAKRRQDKIVNAEDKAYTKIKKIENKGTILDERTRNFARQHEKEAQVKEQYRQQQMINVKPM